MIRGGIAVLVVLAALPAACSSEPEDPLYERLRGEMMGDDEFMAWACDRWQEGNREAVLSTMQSDGRQNLATFDRVRRLMTDEC